MMMINIYMDDCRDCPNGFLLARTTQECLDLMNEHKGNVSILSLDHDMSDNDNDGYWCVKEIVDRGLYSESIYFHTANPVGRSNMYHYFKNAIEHNILPKNIKLYNGPISWE
jgi:hypothetical protein